MSLDGGLSAEGADVFCVLGDFHLLDLLSQRGTVSVNRGIQWSAFSFLSQFIAPDSMLVADQFNER